jgi:hypothetical protein
MSKFIKNHEKTPKKGQKLTPKIPIPYISSENDRKNEFQARITDQN